MTRLEVPGGWCELASPKKVPERKRRQYIAAMTDLSSGTAEIAQIVNEQYGQPGQPMTVPDPRHFGSAHMALADRVSDTLILCLVKEWSFGEVSQDILENLDTDQFDPIFRACRDMAVELVPDYSPDPDPKAPTSGSRLSRPGSSTAELTYATPTSDGTS